MSNKSKIAKEILFALLVGLWAYASASKIINHEKFISALYTTGIFGDYTLYLSYLVPSLEFLISILIMLPAKRLAGLIISLAYLSILTAYLIYMILFSSSL